MESFIEKISVVRKADINGYNGQIGLKLMTKSIV